MRSDEDWLGRHGEALPLYLEDGPAPPIDFLHMRVSPWLQFSTQSTRYWDLFKKGAN